jgi:hypothetical protein
MGRTYPAIDDRLASFLLSQPVFFVASAPLSGDGLVNCSPKSNNGELAVLDPHRICYLDRTGSGVETIAHVRENGRIVLMFCAFEGGPRIVRVHGRGSVVGPDEEAFAELASRFPTTWLDGVRSIIVVTAERISDSCGYGVPLMVFGAHRRQMAEWVERKGEDGVRAYQAEKNAESLDGLPGLKNVTPG